jgi:hypothetical protein
MTARNLLRRVVRLPDEAYDHATVYLTDTLDWFNPWHHQDEGLTEEVKRGDNDDLYPHP